MTIQKIICEIPFIGYLVMIQFTYFSAIQGQQLIAYWTNSDKMRNALMCYGAIYFWWKFHRILYICYLATTESDNIKLIQGH